MNMKKQVFEYMDKHPEATTEDLVAVFPKAKKKSLWNYSRQWKKDHGIQPTSSRNSVRQQVFSYIDQNPDATQKDLQRAFPDANKISISNYHYQWRKSQPHLKKRKTVKIIVFSYLDKHPDATFHELKKALSQINPSSISAYHSIWKQTRLLTNGNQTAAAKPDAATGQTVRQQSQIRPAAKVSDRDIPDRHSTEDLIETLQMTIKTQEIAIEVMKEQNALLRQSQPEMLPELDGVSPEDWEQLRKLIAVFVRGLNNN